jgi:ABC-type transport system involved in cytochrome c biogenesis ATPase subunit
MTPIINICALQHDYIAATKKTPLSFSVKSGGCIVLRGGNGTGKSTLLRLIAGILPVEQGTISVTPSFSYLGAEFGIKESATVLHYQRFITALNGICETILPLHRPIHNLSSGQKLSLRLQSALRPDRKLWILDEPTRFLDQTAIQHLWNCIRLHHEQGGATLIASHDDVPITHHTTTIQL